MPRSTRSPSLLTNLFGRLCAEFRERGILPDMTDVRDTPWRTREFHVRDPDRNGLQFYRDL